MVNRNAIITEERERIERLFDEEIEAVNREALKVSITCCSEIFLLLKRCFLYGD